MAVCRMTDINTGLVFLHAVLGQADRVHVLLDDVSILRCLWRSRRATSNARRSVCVKVQVIDIRDGHREMLHVVGRW